MTSALYAIISVILVSFISFVGLAAFSLSDRGLKLLTFLSIGFAAGALFGDAFIHLIPELFERVPTQTPTYVLLGIFGFFILEKLLRWHHHVSPEPGNPFKPVGYLNLNTREQSAGKYTTRWGFSAIVRLLAIAYRQNSTRE